MKRPVDNFEINFEILKSKFLVKAETVESPEEAKAAVKARWAVHPQASHVVWAFKIGRAGETLGMSDDREPSGTAGRPTLEVLKNSELTNCLITTVRYFGGTKLGTGGLVRAYTEAAQRVLEGLPAEEIIDRVSFSFTVDYPFYDGVKAALSRFKIVDLSEEFTETVTLQGRLPETERETFRTTITDATSGRSLIRYF